MIFISATMAETFVSCNKEYTKFSIWEHVFQDVLSLIAFAKHIIDTAFRFAHTKHFNVATSVADPDDFWPDPDPDQYWFSAKFLLKIFFGGRML
jgi:hypothetical protein